ncbi:hypothetical protein B0T16DRAFT_422481, partial [Cercophora newfieldiana]
MTFNKGCLFVGWVWKERIGWSGDSWWKEQVSLALRMGGSREAQTQPEQVSLLV